MGRFVAQYWVPPSKPGAFDRGEPGTEPVQYEAFVPDPIRDLDFRASARTRAVLKDARDAIEAFQAAASAVGSIDALARAVRRAEVLQRELDEHRARRWEKRMAREREVEQAAQRRTEACIGVLLEHERAGDRAWPAAICAAHRLLLEGVDTGAKPGQYRTIPIWIGHRDGVVEATNPTEGGYVAPPAGMVGDLMEDLGAFMSRTDIDPLAHAAIIHGQFQIVHPFQDGNGRLGRCLHHPIVARLGDGSWVAPPVGIELARRFDAYVVGMRSAWYEGDLDSWVAIFARLLERSARHASDLARRFEQAEQDWVASIVERPASSRRLLGRTGRR